jgi:energy-coupling factor transporter ATP-binding protein EcfA2
VLPPNPFRPTKIEQDKDPVFLLSTIAREIPSNFKHVHVLGSRGSGKTTLLRSLRTAEIRSNHTLRAQYGKATFDWFGVYLQFNRTFQSLMSSSGRSIIRLLGDAGQDEEAQSLAQFRIFQSYFELTILSSFIDDLIAVSDRREIFLTSAVEREIAYSILSRLHVACDDYDVFAVKRELDRCKAFYSALPTEYSVRALSTFIDSFAPGDLLTYAMEIANGLRGQLVRKDVPIRLMVLIDDAESLNGDQQAITNTILKQIEGRIKFVIAYIAGQYDPNSTLLPNTVLNNDDYSVVPLDDESHSDFKNFFERVTDLRLKTYYQLAAGDPNQPLKTFSLRKTLGVFKPNELIAAATAGSQSVTVQKWRSAVEATRAQLRFIISKKNWPKYSLNENQTPFIEHELIKLLNIDIGRLASLSQQDAIAKVFDRKQLGAMLYIAHKILPIHNVPYAGADVVVGLATGRIRDFLDIMAEIYDAAIREYDPSWRVAGIPNIKHIQYFANPDRPISPDIQLGGILAASEAKWNILENFTIRTSFNLPLVVAGLAALTQRLQLPKNAYGYVSQPDRGIFTFDPEKLDTILATRRVEVRSDDVIRALQRDGFVKVLSSRTRSTTGFLSQNLEEFHLHRRLFPRLGIAYRGPYERFRLNEQALGTLIVGKEVAPERWADEVLKSTSVEDAPTQEQFRL